MKISLTQEQELDVRVVVMSRIADLYRCRRVYALGSVDRQERVADIVRLIGAVRAMKLGAVNEKLPPAWRYKNAAELRAARAAGMRRAGK